MTGMTSMKDPTKRFSEVIGRVASVVPFLNGKVLDENMSRAVSRDASLDHFYGRLIITTEEWSRGKLQEAPIEVPSSVGLKSVEVPSRVGMEIVKVLSENVDVPTIQRYIS
jgi:hypothetical protein